MPEPVAIPAGRRHGVGRRQRDRVRLRALAVAGVGLPPVAGVGLPKRSLPKRSPVESTGRIAAGSWQLVVARGGFCEHGAKSIV
jgi:hypothetical protein